MNEKINLKQIMKHKKIKQQELADKMGCSRQEVSDWSTGRRVPSLRRIYKIAEALEIPASLLIADPEDLDNLMHLYDLMDRPDLLRIIDLLWDMSDDKIDAIKKIVEMSSQ